MQWFNEFINDSRAGLPLNNGLVLVYNIKGSKMDRDMVSGAFQIKF